MARPHNLDPIAHDRARLPVQGQSNRRQARAGPARQADAAAPGPDLPGVAGRGSRPEQGPPPPPGPVRRPPPGGQVGSPVVGRDGTGQPAHRRVRPKEIPSPDVVQQLIVGGGARGQPVFAAAIAIAATTGLRRGELAGLRWSDIDLAAGRLHVRRAIKNDLDGSWIEGPPKTHQARRVALDAFTLAVLSDSLRARAEAWARRRGVVRSGRLRPHTGPIRRQADPTGHARPGLRPDLPAAGVTEVSLHTLRHFSASMLIASGRDVRTIAGRLGHQTPRPRCGYTPTWSRAGTRTPPTSSAACSPPASPLRSTKADQLTR